jgi:hypothetical protein
MANGHSNKAKWRNRWPGDNYLNKALWNEMLNFLRDNRAFSMGILNLRHLLVGMVWIRDKLMKLLRTVSKFLPFVETWGSSPSRNYWFCLDFDCFLVDVRLGRGDRGVKWPKCRR